MFEPDWLYICHGARTYDEPLNKENLAHWFTQVTVCKVPIHMVFFILIVTIEKRATPFSTQCIPSPDTMLPFLAKSSPVPCLRVCVCR